MSSGLLKVCAVMCRKNADLPLSTRCQSAMVLYGQSNDCSGFMVASRPQTPHSPPPLSMPASPREARLLTLPCHRACIPYVHGYLIRGLPCTCTAVLGLT